MVVHEVIIDDDEERFASLEDLNTGPGTSVGDDQVGSRDVLQSSLHSQSMTMYPPASPLLGKVCTGKSPE